MNLITITIDADREVAVPKEPTAEMLNAGESVEDREMTRWIFLAMLEAAPKRQQVAMDERTEFEKCFSTKWPAYGHWNPFGIDSDGSYSSSHVHAAFLGWENGRSAL